MENKERKDPLIIGSTTLAALGVGLLILAGIGAQELATTYSHAVSYSLAQCLPSVPRIAAALAMPDLQSLGTSFVPHAGFGPEPPSLFPSTQISIDTGPYIEAAESICRDAARNVGLDSVRQLLGNVLGSFLE